MSDKDLVILGLCVLFNEIMYLFVPVTFLSTFIMVAVDLFFIALGVYGDGN